MGIEVNKTFIPYTLDIGFNNNLNLKQDIQNRIGNDTEINFENALNNIQGDSKESKGEDFSELVLLALAYFYDKVFPRDKHQIKNSYWTVTAVKGFFDACNLTPYTAIDEVVTTYFPLRETALFKDCYLIIQTAYFFNAGQFGKHEYLVYTGHYTRHWNKLPIDEYKGDKKHLKLSYKRLDDRKAKGNLPSGQIEYYYVEQWYYSILYLVVKELGLSERHFRVTSSKHRDFNPVIKTPRILRYETPFLLTHIDIKSAYPSFLDAITGSNIGLTIYDRIAKTRGVSRDKAKVHLNMMLNSGKKDYWKKDKAIQDLKEWGYTETQANLITRFTHGDKSFTEEMSEIEEEAIHLFARVNGIDKYVRLHDAIIYIDNKKPNKEFKLQNGIIRFESEHPKKPNLNPTFGMSDRRLSYGYVSSVPNLKNLIRRSEPSNRKEQGRANGFIFYKDKFQYYNASFDLNDNFDKDSFKEECREMLECLYFLNDRKVTDSELEAIVRHIRAYSNICFQYRFMYLELKNLNSEVHPQAELKERDWEAIERKVFRTKTAFLVALNGARKKSNQILFINQVRKKFIESLELDEVHWIEFGLPKRNPSYKLAYVIASRINYLRTGRKRNPKAQIDNGEPLYSNMYKEPRLNTFEPQSKYSNTNNLVRRKIKAYERKLLELLQFQTNRNQSEQYVFILDEVINKETDLPIQPNQSIIQDEKDYLLKQMEVESFKELILIKGEKKINPLQPSEAMFCNDTSNSIFNHIDEQQAYEKGILDEYEKFHGINQPQPYVFKPKPLKEVVNKQNEIFK